MLFRIMAISLFLGAFSSPAAGQTEEATSITPSPSAAWSAAEANRDRVKTAPSFVDGPHADLTDAEKALGHHGPVLIQGIIGLDGKMAEARVKTSSGAPTLDGIALAAATASTFVPAKDADGAALPVVIVMPFDLVAYKAVGGMGITKYSCAQFVRDMDWWASAHPDKTFKDHELYRMELGFEMMAMISQARGNNAALGKSINAFADRWTAAIDLCRTKPTMLQRDAIYR
jgi:TonB family protein